MNFIEAIKLLNNGKKVRRKTWSNSMSIMKRYSVIWRSSDHDYKPSIDSILADDWEVVE
jgi:hypothetical protein